MPYQGRQPGIGVRNRFVYTATGGQTTFSGADSNGKTLAYQDGAYVDVYLNGVMLVPTTDFTATTKTSITLTSGATASDIVEILAYDISSIADTVSKSQGGTFAGNVAVTGNLTVDTDTLFVDAANNRVGIGTSSPSVRLHVSGASVPMFVNSTDSNLFKLGFLDAGSVVGYIGAGSGAEFAVASSAGTERLRVDSSGNVGVGTSSPAVQLHATGVGRFSQLQMPNSAGTYTSGSAGFHLFGFSDDNLYFNWFDAGAIVFRNNGSNERMRIDSSGNVGIGVSSPLTKAHIQGSDVSFTPDTNADMLIVENSGTSAIQIVGATNGKSELFFSDTTRNRGGFSYEHSTDHLGLFTNGAEQARIDLNGNLLVGTTSAIGKLTAVAGSNQNGLRAQASTGGYVGVYGEHSLNGGTGYAAYFFNTGSSTGLYISNTAAWQAVSDARLKEDVKDLDATDRLMQLRPVDYLWKHQATSEEPDRRNLGFIAQEVQEVFPELVSTSPDGMLGVEYTGLIAPLVKAIQDQQAIIEALEARITALEA